MTKPVFDLPLDAFYTFVGYFRVVTDKMNERDTIKTWTLHSSETYRQITITNDVAEGFTVAVGRVGEHTFYADVTPIFETHELPMGWKTPHAVVNVACGFSKMTDKLLSMLPKYREQMVYATMRREQRAALQHHKNELRYEFFIASGAPSLQYNDWITVTTTRREDTHDSIKMAIAVEAEERLDGAYIDRITVHLNKLPPWLARKVIQLILDNAEVDPGYGAVQSDDEVRKAIWKL